MLSEYRSFLVEELSPINAYKLIVGAVQPRPIAWISTVSLLGVRNLAPFSFFNVASRNPLMVMISIGESDRDSAPEKDTLANIRATNEFVVNVVSEELLSAMVASSEPVAQGDDEFTLAGLEATDSLSVLPPRVTAAPLSMECVLEDLRPYGTDHVVVGRVLRIHAAPGIVSDTFHVQTTLLKPVGRMAGPLYCTGLDPQPAGGALAGLGPGPAEGR